MSAQPLLKIDNLRTYFYSRSKHSFVRAVDGVSLAVGHAARRSAWSASPAAAKASPPCR